MSTLPPAAPCQRQDRWQAGQAPVESMWGQCGQGGGQQGCGAGALTGAPSSGQMCPPSLGCSLAHRRWGRAACILDGLLGFTPLFTFALTPTVPKPEAVQTTGCGLTLARQPLAPPRADESSAMASPQPALAHAPAKAPSWQLLPAGESQLPLFIYFSNAA